MAVELARRAIPTSVRPSFQNMELDSYAESA